MSAHPYLTDWRESQLAAWRHTDLNPDHTEPTHDANHPAQNPRRRPVRHAA